MTSTDDVSQNLDIILKLLEETEEAETQFISFPENSLYLRVDMDAGEKYALELEDDALRQLSEYCRSHKVCVHLGSIPLLINGKIHNCSVLIDDQGKRHADYSKMHLFDIFLKDKKPILESDYYQKGEKPEIFEWQGFRFGLSICYDLRFSELFNYYARKEVDVLLIPAAFLPTTGKAHWEVLLRARAIENQAYVLAAAQAGEHVSTKTDSRRSSYGNSLVVDPWGEVLCHVKEEGSNVVFAQLEKSRIQHVREQVPMKNHRRFQPNWSWT